MSIVNKAMLVDLDISVIGTSKKDEAITAEAQQKNGAAKESGYFLKRIIDKKFTTFNTIASQARTYHRKITLAWGDNGERLLPSKLYYDYTTEMADFKTQFEMEVQKFISIYPKILADMPAVLGKMFNPDDYPPQSDLPKYFSFETKIRPVPNAQDFRVDISEDEVKKIRDHIEQENQKLQKKAMDELWQKLYEPVKKMAEKLSDKDAKRYHKSLIENIIEITDILPMLNIKNDQALETLRKEIIDRLCNVTISDIKESLVVRQETADAATDIINQMETYMGITNQNAA